MRGNGATGVGLDAGVSGEGRGSTGAAAGAAAGIGAGRGGSGGVWISCTMTALSGSGMSVDHTVLMTAMIRAAWTMMASTKLTTLEYGISMFGWAERAAPIWNDSIQVRADSGGLHWIIFTNSPGMGLAEFSAG